MKNVLNSIQFCVFACIAILILMTFAACTTNPPGCPLPEYSKGDFVLVDNVFIGKVLGVKVEECGDIKYSLELNVTDDDGIFWLVVEGVEEGRLSPYEPVSDG